MEKFIMEMAEIMEVEAGNLTAETIFREACEFDSMKGFMMICNIADEYGKDLTVNEFLMCKTLGDLYSKTVA
jgi:acyl carrier protein